MDRETWLENQYRICREIMPAVPAPPEEQKAIYEMLSAPLDDDMIKHVPASAGAARGGKTGYSEAGIVDRMNRVLGPGGWMTVTRIGRESTKDKWYHALMDLLLWVPRLNRFVDTVGFGRGLDPGDAEKGARTTAMKRACREVGPGWQAYAGIIDQDLQDKGEF